MFFDLPGIRELTAEVAADVGEWFTEKKKIECYIVVGRDGNNVVRIRLEADRNDYHQEFGLACRITEINGETVSEDEQGEKVVREKFIGTVPTAEKQTSVISAVLIEFGFPIDFYPVSDEYATGKIRIIRLRKRIIEKRKEEQ